ncbi:MAG: MFS transporter, partial [Pseudomonadota bacterium]
MSSEQNIQAEAAARSAWAPFGYRAFVVLWTATVISSVGTWMHDVGAGWLMTELSPSPAVVAAVQAATTLPIFLFALLAGAVADLVDKRKLLITVNCLMAVVAATLAIVVWQERMTPILLLLFTFLMGTGAAFSAPAWQAIVPKLVERKDLSSAIALNSMGINISRAIGPALAGFLIVAIGLTTPFALNALSFIGIIAALLWWRSSAQVSSGLPREHVGGAIRAGLGYAWNSLPVRSTLVRAGAFFLFASAYWAMLPLIARQVLEGGPTLYGLLLAAVGVGAVLGALILPKLRTRFDANVIVAVGTAGTATVLCVFAAAPIQSLAITASLFAGLFWIAVLSSLHVSAQTALPDWVRARGLSIFLTVFFGAMALGSLVWGQIATQFSIPFALLTAALGAVLLIPLTWPFKLGLGERLDLTPSSHWPEPVIDGSGPAKTDGPVMIQVEYHIAPEQQEEFLSLVAELARSRKRHGAYHWQLMRDAENATHMTEVWFEASWTEHLRHHERVTEDDKHIQQRIHELHQAQHPDSDQALPKVT